jgi:hypothetical protein
MGKQGWIDLAFIIGFSMAPAVAFCVAFAVLCLVFGIK